MPRAVQTTIYRFDELSEGAQENALNKWLSLGDYWHWQEDWWNSATAFCDIAPISIKSADYESAHVSSTFEEPSWGENPLGELSGVRAWTWLLNNGWFDLAEKNARGDCTLTGYCGDCPLFDPIHKLRHNPSAVPDLESLFTECLESWVVNARADLEACQTLEYFADLCDANDWEFTGNGVWA